jgi:hypothetical protein
MSTRRRGRYLAARDGAPGELPRARTRHGGGRRRACRRFRDRCRRNGWGATGGQRAAAGKKISQGRDRHHAPGRAAAPITVVRAYARRMRRRLHAGAPSRAPHLQAPAHGRGAQQRCAKAREQRARRRRYRAGPRRAGWQTRRARPAALLPAPPRRLSPGARCRQVIWGRGLGAEFAASSGVRGFMASPPADLWRARAAGASQDRGATRQRSAPLTGPSTPVHGAPVRPSQPVRAAAPRGGARAPPRGRCAPRQSGLREAPSGRPFQSSQGRLFTDGRPSGCVVLSIASIGALLGPGAGGVAPSLEGGRGGKAGGAPSIARAARARTAAGREPRRRRWRCPGSQPRDCGRAEGRRAGQEGAGLVRFDEAGKGRSAPRSHRQPGSRPGARGRPGAPWQCAV